MLSNSRALQDGVPSTAVEGSFLSRTFNWIPVLVLAYAMVLSPFLIQYSGETVPTTTLPPPNPMR